MRNRRYGEKFEGYYRQNEGGSVPRVGMLFQICWLTGDGQKWPQNVQLLRHDVGHGVGPF